MCNIIPQAWNNHTVIVIFQHELFVHSFQHNVWRVTVLRLPLFTYYLAHRWMVSCLLNSIFKLKEQTICNVYSIIPEAWNIQACKYMQACGIHVVSQVTWKNTWECSGNRVAILDYFNLDLDFWWSKLFLIYFLSFLDLIPEEKVATLSGLLDA